MRERVLSAEGGANAGDDVVGVEVELGEEFVRGAVGDEHGWQAKVDALRRGAWRCGEAFVDRSGGPDRPVSSVRRNRFAPVNARLAGRPRAINRSRISRQISDDGSSSGQ